jgi:acyl-CoA synthetase (AMP-forming)/AMP-acid ligase II
MIKHSVATVHAAARPNADALVDATGSGRRISWAELEDLVARAATGLTQLLLPATGSAAPIRAAFLADNRWELTVLQGAAATLSLPLAGIDASLPPQAVAACLDQVRPTVLAVAPQLRPLARQALTLLRTQPPAPPIPGHSSGIQSRPIEPIELELVDGPAADCSMVGWADLVARRQDPGTWLQLPFQGLGFTSGTTGNAKLVLRSRSFEAQRQRDVTELIGVSAEDVYLNAVPLSHASGPGWARVYATAGASIVLTGHDDPAALAAALAAEQVTATLLVPPVLATVLDHLEAHPQLRLAALRTVVTGGRHLHPTLVQRSRERLGDVLRLYYGTTETGLNTLTSPGELSACPSSAGRPLPGNEIRIVDDTGRALPAGQAGQIAIASYMLADGYATSVSPTIDADDKTWWLTPDTGHLNGEGRLFVHARDLPASAAGLDVVTLEGQLQTALSARDVVVLLNSGPACSDKSRGSSGTGPLQVIVAYAGTDRGQHPDEIVAATRRFAGPALAEAHIQAIAVPAIPYSPTGKVHLPRLHALLDADAVPVAPAIPSPRDGDDDVRTARI